MDQQRLELYSDSLLSWLGATTATGLSARVEGPYATIKARACGRQATTMAVSLRVKTQLPQVILADGYLSNDEVERGTLMALEPAAGYVAALCGAGAGGLRRFAARPCRADPSQSRCPLPAAGRSANRRRIAALSAAMRRRSIATSDSDDA